VVITGAYAIKSEYRFRKGSDPIAGMEMYIQGLIRLTKFNIIWAIPNGISGM